MNRKIYAIYVFMLFALSGIMNPGKADAGIDVNVNIGFPPAIMIPAAPELVLIPKTNSYIIPDIDVDIIFHNGYWYRPHRGYWYRADSYNGPWINIVPAKIPVALLELPPDYRHLAHGQARIPYGQLKKRWEKREEARHHNNKKHKYIKKKRKHR
jgi:hypothetical protein